MNLLKQSLPVALACLSASCITEINKGQRAITAETALTLGVFFNMEPHFWMNLPSHCNFCRVQFAKEAGLRKRIQPLPLTPRFQYNSKDYNCDK